jgi:hypothetical protein
MPKAPRPILYQKVVDDSVDGYFVIEVGCILTVV